MSDGRLASSEGELRVLPPDGFIRLVDRGVETGESDPDHPALRELLDGARQLPNVVALAAAPDGLSYLLITVLPADETDPAATVEGTAEENTTRYGGDYEVSTVDLTGARAAAQAIGHLGDDRSFVHVVAVDDDGREWSIQLVSSEPIEWSPTDTVEIE